MSHSATVFVPNRHLHVWTVHPGVDGGARELPRIRDVRVDLWDLLRRISLLVEDVHLREGSGEKLCPSLGIRAVFPSHTHCVGGTSVRIHERRRIWESRVLLQFCVCADRKLDDVPY